MATASQLTIPSLIDNERMGAFQWRVIALCFLIALFDGFDTQAIAFTGPAILAAFNLPPGSLAPILTAGIIGMTLGAMTLGMLGDKDVAGVIRLLRDRVDHWVLTSLPGPRGLSAARLAEILREVGVSGGVSEHDSPRAAYQVARDGAAEGDRIVIFGSFLTVADVLAAVKAPQ